MLYCPVTLAFDDETWSTDPTLTYGDGVVANVIDCAG